MQSVKSEMVENEEGIVFITAILYTLTKTLNPNQPEKGINLTQVFMACYSHSGPKHIFNVPIKRKWSWNVNEKYLQFSHILKKGIMKNDCSQTTYKKAWDPEMNGGRCWQVDVVLG